MGEARRAAIILLLAQGHSFRSIRSKLACTDRSINTWKQRFLAQRLPGLASRYRGRKTDPQTAPTQARILEAMRHPPRDGTTHWSTRRLARRLGTSHSAIARTEESLRPRRAVDSTRWRPFDRLSAGSLSSPNKTGGMLLPLILYSLG